MTAIEAPPSTDGLAAGEVLPRAFGKYTLLRELASGGMAKVYLAIQRAVAGFEKLVVVKRILPELARDPNFVEMLLAEARTAATLNHPNVVQTFDVGEHEGTYFIAMEYINGEDVRSIVRGMKNKNVSEIPLEHTLTIITGMCAGLAYAHEKRGLDGEPLDIVHRDISPQNVLITFTGDVKIVDFGIAKSSEAAVGEKTTAGQLKGKVPYMSPEQARGEEIDHRSDIFALGIMLFELTTGRRLFKAKSDYDTLRLICDREYPRPSQLLPEYPPALEAIVMRALEKDRDTRYQSARDMQADLEAFIREEKIAASTVSLSTWMNFLFEEKIAQQKTVLLDAKQLADVIATQQTESNTDWLKETSVGLNAITMSGTDVTGLHELKKRQTRLFVGLGALVVALGAAGAYSAVTSKKEPTVIVQPAPPPAPEPEVKRGKLTVKKEPANAWVRIAGEVQGQMNPVVAEKLPLDMELEVKVSKDGYEDAFEKVTFSAESLEREISVKLVKGTVTFVFDVEPRTATLTFDDKLQQIPSGGWMKGSKLEELSAGDHRAMFSAPGFLPETVRWKAVKGETKTVIVNLKKGDSATTKPAETASSTSSPPPPSGGRGTVNVNSRGGYCASTTVNGKNVGPTPVAGVSVTAGPVSVVCKTADGKTFSGGGMVKDGETARISVSIN
ncbi:MAG: serine/threonine protein kinase [Deltaproteobacteria bacterium]|nr:serine/threonine protein kinase [Deltaproteobacteria bacterium]